jgi:hypothetical protein
MTFSPEFLLIVSVGVVGVLHTIVPGHWVPITLIARQRGWSKSETVSQHNCHLRRALRHLDGTLAARQSRRVRALWSSRAGNSALPRGLPRHAAALTNRPLSL